MDLLDTITKLLHPKNAAEVEQRELREELSHTRLALHQAQGRFEIASDPLLVEAAVYELLALRARHAFLMGRIKGALSNLEKEVG